MCELRSCDGVENIHTPYIAIIDANVALNCPKKDPMRIIVWLWLHATPIAMDIIDVATNNDPNTM